MSKPSRKKQEKKLRKQRKERAKRAVPAGVVAYYGGKYRTTELAPLHLATETGVLEAFVISQRKATDRQAAAAIEGLVLRIRRGEPIDVDLGDDVHYLRGDEVALFVEMILRNWRDFFLKEELLRRQSRPSRDTLIGVLRSVLGSIEFHTSAGPEARGYLEYVEEFLAEFGITAGEAADEDEDEEHDDHDEDANGTEHPLGPRPHRGLFPPR